MEKELKFTPIYNRRVEKNPEINTKRIIKRMKWTEEYEPDTTEIAAKWLCIGSVATMILLNYLA